MAPEKSLLVEDIGDMLMECDLFNNLPPAEIKSAARYFSVSNIGEGATIFNEGDDGTFMCIVNSGSVSILKSNLDEKVVKIATLRKGRTFGEMAVLDGERRSARCVAETECTLLTLSRDSLDKMLLEMPRTAARVIRAVAVSLSRRLRMADGKLVDHQI
jgi:CRP/FNR family transcriptional regulator, cyclic AMP receptor protein